MSLVLAFDHWPETDQTMWRALIRSADPFDDPGALSELRETSRITLQLAYGRWLAWLATSDPQALREASPERATMARLADWLHSLAHVAPMTRAWLIRDTLRVLRGAAPDGDWKAQAKLRKRLQSLAGRGLQTRKQGRILSSKVLLEAGLRCAGPMADDQGNPFEAARLRRDGAMVAMLALMPMRRRAFVNLELGASLLIQGDEIIVALPEELMKTGQAWEAAVPESILPTLRRYMDEVRPWFMTRAGTRHNHLWVGDRGRPYALDHFGARMRDITERLTGVEVSPHFFRDATATTLARMSPESARLIRPILAHSSFETTERHYNHARTIDAGRDYAAVIARLKGKKSP